MNSSKKIASEANLDGYLQKIWRTAFTGIETGLISPAQIRRERRIRSQVREKELTYIKLAEKDLEAIQNGDKSIDENGHIHDTPRFSDDDISMNSIIERENMAADDVELRLGANNLLKHISHELRLKDLRRSLHIRKIAIFAEKIASDSFKGYCSERRVDPDWAERWREYAQDTFGESVQRLWARVLSTEVQNPGSISIYTLDFIRHLSSMDVELITIAARLSFNDFIYREAKEYFTVGIHGVMFTTLEELGLLRGVSRGDLWKDVSSPLPDYQHVSAILKCRNKALYVKVNYAEQDLHLPVFIITHLGQEVMSVIDADADMAYLWAVAKDLKSKGCSVQLGDVVERNGVRDVFMEKISL